MKKIILPLILMTIFFIPGMKVDAKTINVSYPQSVKWLHSNCGSDDTACTTFLHPEFLFSKYDIEYMYNYLLDIYNSDYKEQYPYYLVNFINESYPNGELIYNKFVFQLFESIPSSDSLPPYSNIQISFTYSSGTHTFSSSSLTTAYYSPFKIPITSSSEYVYAPMLLYDSNFDLTNNTDNIFYVSDIDLIVEDNGIFTPYLKSSLYTSNFIEVNLDDYEYVILNLKDYNQTDAFSTNLQVKGMVGITPVYEFGTVEKSEITDRCNISYLDYTDYRFSILKSDLQNNAVYYVKACEDNSSFKFDKNIFDITYITSENIDDPTITVGGKNYNVIPFTKLSNTANKNEENNFIPGESKNSLTDIIDNFSDFGSDIWNAISSFMSLVTKFFNTLPEEFRYLSITAFSTLVIIAIIKFIKG